MRLWPFGRERSIKPVIISEVAAAPPPNAEIERQRDIAGLTLQRERVLTAKLAGQLQESLAAGVLLELRGGRT